MIAESDSPASDANGSEGREVNVSCFVAIVPFHGSRLRIPRRLRAQLAANPRRRRHCDALVVERCGVVVDENNSAKAVWSHRGIVIGQGRSCKLA